MPPDFVFNLPAAEYEAAVSEVEKRFDERSPAAQKRKAQADKRKPKGTPTDEFNKYSTDRVVIVKGG